MSIPPKNILVPTDFSASAEAAFDYAIALAKTNNARVTLLHTYEIPIVGFPDGAMVASAEIATRIANVSQQALDAAAAKHRDSGVDLTTRLLNGETRSVILETASEVGADLIVIGTRGRRGVAHLLLGSTAEHIVRASTVPVLTVHARK